jgi:hypothetical protein
MTTSSRFRRFVCLLPAGLALLAASCGSGIEPLPMTDTSLEGTVTYGGQKVPLALVIVVQEKGGSAQAFADDEGNYKVDNVPVGKVKIAVNTDATKGELMKRQFAGSDPNAKGGKRAAPPKILEVPKKYHTPDVSPLTTDTQKGANKYDIVIPK